MQEQKSLLHIALFFFFALAFVSCQESDVPLERPHKVLILQSYSTESEQTQKATELYNKAFQEEGLNVELEFLNGEMPHMNRANIMWDYLTKYIDTQKEDPEVIIINDDDMFHSVMSDSAWATRAPIVFGGVNYLGDYNPGKYKNITGFLDTPDLKENLRLIKELTGTNLIYTVLSIHDEDEYRKEALTKAVQELGMVHDVDQSISKMSTLRLHDNTKTYILTLSAAHPEINSTDSTESDRTLIMENAILNAKYAKHLQLRWSTTSNTFIDRSEAPQFTAVNELFGSKHPRFLAGYFTSLETQIQDEVHYAAEILRGTSLSLLPLTEHKKGYYMDYRAMEKLNLKLDDYQEKFTIINVPFHVKHPILYGLIIMGVTILGMLILALLTYLLITAKNRKQRKMLHELAENNRKRELALGQSMTTIWQVKDGYVYQVGSNLKTSIRNFRTFIHPDHQEQFNRILNIEEPNGKHMVRMQIAYDRENYHWYELIYNITDKNRKERHIEGVSMNIDTQKRNEETIFKTNENQELVNIKETIMANMSHDIRTPLGAIVGFADIMAAEGDLLVEEERMEYADIIKQNSLMLETMISDILDEKSEIGVFKFHFEEVNISKLIHQVWVNNKILCPKHLVLCEQQDWDSSLTLNIDMNRIQEVLNNFLSNAFKFTPDGTITLGWRVATDEIELYVQDTGVGIAKENLDTVFDRYYKTAETHKGTGMGLNICKTIIEQHGGHVKVASDLGKGSRFSAFLKKEKEGGAA